MDDNEYYKMMRNQYSHHIQKKTDRTSGFTKWNSRQGREDAEMLAEKTVPVLKSLNSRKNSGCLKNSRTAQFYRLSIGSILETRTKST